MQDSSQNPPATTTPSETPMTAPAPETQPTVPTTPAPKKGDSLLWILFGLTAALAVVTGFFIWQNISLKKQLTVATTKVPKPYPPETKDGGDSLPSPTTDPMSDWSSYTNDYYELKYPNSWKAEEQIDDSGGVVGKYPILLISSLDTTEKVFYQVVVNIIDTTNQDVNSYVESLLMSKPAGSPVGITYEKQELTTINGLDAIKLQRVLAYDRYEDYVYLFNKNRIYIFHFPVAEINQNLANPIANNQTANQILSTFQFTKSTD